MISSFHVKRLMSMSVNDILAALEQGGYTDVFIDRCYFLGITDTNKFCYSAFYRDDYGVVGSIKVYVHHDSKKGCAVAEF